MPVIEIRFSSLEEQSGDRRFDIKEGETLTQAVDRSLEGIDLGERKASDVFQALVDGHKIEPEFWSYVALTKDSAVLIAPIIRGGDAGSLFRQIAILTVAVVASTLLSPAVGGGLLGAFAAAGVTAVASLVLNSLIPPTIPGMDTLSANPETSQTYSVAGQSNQVKQFGVVPKVYGKHRVFPAVAANPYVQLEVDSSLNIVQYLYAVYDLGLGPMQVDQVRIGDSLISQFTDVEYFLVDFNKPAVSEGSWDSVLRPALTYYKGDNEVEALSIVLDQNLAQGGAPNRYSALRTSAPNPNLNPQEIILSFVNPNGLYAYSSNNVLVPRRIELRVQFRKVGGDGVLRNFNDFSYVSQVSAIGSSSGNNLRTFFNERPPQSYAVLSTSTARLATPEERATYNLSSSQLVQDRTWGYPAGTVDLLSQITGDISVGQLVTIGKVNVGTIASIAYDGIGQVNRLANPLNFDYPIYSGFVLAFGEDGFQPYNAVVQQQIFVTQNLTGRAFIERAETSPVYSEIRFTPREVGQFEVFVTRYETTSAFNNAVQDTLTWYAISTRIDQSPIVTTKRHVFLEVRIRATNQLNGTIQNLNAVCTSVLDVWNGSAWVKQPTSNPAWVFADLLTGEVNKRAIEKSRLHTPSLLTWANFASQVPTPPPGSTFTFGRFNTNFILDYAATLQNVINQVTSGAQASLNIIDGKYGVLVDRLVTTPVQVFTPRNSRGFTSTRIYAPKPHAFKVKYVDSGSNWEVKEVTVYEDGYTFVNSTEFEDLTAFGCTNQEQAWRFGRYMLAQNRLRQENIQIEVDFEHLVCTRGDYVQITQDVMKVGGTPARVIEVTGNQIVIDDGIESAPGFDYGYVLRKKTGQIVTSTLTILFADTFELDGDLPEVGDLIVIGAVDQIVYDCLVKSISPTDDLSAAITLVEKADGVYAAESTNTYPVYNPQVSITNSDFQPPGAVSNFVIADNAYDCAADRYRYYIVLDWDAPNAAFEDFEIYVDSGQGYNLVARTRESLYTYNVDELKLGIQHKFKVLAVSSTGKKIELGVAPEILATPMRKSTPPSDVPMLSIDITGEVIQLVWTPILDCGTREYRIRYSPTMTGSWQQSIPLLRTDRNTTIATAQARTGMYLLKAVDFNGNESANAAIAITTIPQLFNLNVIEEITDAPAFLGLKDRVSVSTGAVVLNLNPVGDGDSYYSEGYYYYKSLLELGDIYTVRLQSLIQAEGLTSSGFMVDWLTLSSVSALALAGSADWDVETQYRSSESYNTISEWSSLAAIDIIAGGDPENFTEWRRFTMGDVTGQVFQFRLKLISYVPNVTPRVFDAKIRADMPDRVDSYENLLSDAVTGYTLNYVPPFKGPMPSPNVQISIDGAESGDYWDFSYKGLDGFTIMFYDRDDNPVARQFDVVAKGYGRQANSVI